MRNLFWGSVLILFGLGILLDNLGVLDFEQMFRDFWPLLLILWGVSVIVRRRKPPAPPPAPPPPPPGETLGTGEPQSFASSDLVHQSNVFGDIVTRITSQSFRGGSVSTVFGDCDLDISGTVFAPGDHELRVHGVFGDSTVSVPKEAAISISAHSLFGDVTLLGEHKHGISTDVTSTTPAYATQTNRLKLSITKVFGDIRVQ